MKHTFLSIIAAAALGTFTASALDASAKVKVNLQKGIASSLRVERLSVPQRISFSKSMDKFIKEAETGQMLDWQMVNIPLEITAAKDAGSKYYPDFLPSLTVHAYLLIEAEDRSLGETRSVILDKEMTFVDIPLKASESASSELVSKTNIPVFISPSNAKKLNEKAKGNSRGSLENKLQALAIEVSINGANCLNSKSEEGQSVIIEKSLKPKLSGKKWWKSERKNTYGAALSALNETPFVGMTGNVFPAMARTAGSNATGEGSATSVSPKGAGSTIDSESITPSSDSTSGSTTTDSTTDSVEGAVTPAGRKAKKGRRASSRTW